MEKNLEIAGGNYDFGARNYDGRIGRWWSVDAFEDAYPGASPYSFALNTPIQALDPDGNFVIFVNGLTTIFGISTSFMPAGPLEEYWGPYIQGELISIFNPSAFGGRDFSSFNFETATALVNDYPHKLYVDGQESYYYTGTASSATSGARSRYDQGYSYASENYDEIIAQYEAELAHNSKATLDIVTHSQGAAYGEGIAAYINGRGKYTVNTLVHLQPAESYTLSYVIGTRGSSGTSTNRIEFHTQSDYIVNKFGGRLEQANITLLEQVDVSTYNRKTGNFASTNIDVNVKSTGYTNTLKSNYSFGVGLAHGARYPGRVRADAITEAIRDALRNDKKE